MRRIFVDTSAILALLVPTDRCHGDARAAFDRLRAEEAGLVTTSYVLVETYALVGRRFGLAAVGKLREGFSGLLEVIWIDEGRHERGLDLLLAQGWRRLSLVDAISFVTMRDLGLDTAFAFDPHFTQEGFELLGPVAPEKA